jgi:hypothetical protein
MRLIICKSSFSAFSRQLSAWDSAGPPQKIGAKSVRLDTWPGLNEG